MRKPEPQRRHHEPLQDRGEACAEHWQSWHGFFIGPGFADIDIQPLTEYRVNEPESDSRNGDAQKMLLRPLMLSKDNDCQRQRTCSDQQISTSAVDDRE